MDEHLINELRTRGIDYENGVERFGGNAELFEKFIRRFSDDPHFDELKKYLSAQDTEAAFRTAHTLKGVVGNLSFTDYYEAVSELSEHLRAGNTLEAEKSLQAVESAHENVLAALKSF